MVIFRRLLRAQGPRPYYNTVLWAIQSTKEHILAPHWTRDMTSDRLCRFSLMSSTHAIARDRGARVALVSRNVPASAQQRTHLKLCVSAEPKIATNSHPGGPQCPSCGATRTAAGPPRGRWSVLRARGAYAARALSVRPGVQHACDR